MNEEELKRIGKSASESSERCLKSAQQSIVFSAAPSLANIYFNLTMVDYSASPHFYILASAFIFLSVLFISLSRRNDELVLDVVAELERTERRNNERNRSY